MNRRHRMALADARQPWGCGWMELTEEHRRALIAQAAVVQLLLQDDSLEKYAPAKKLILDAMGPYAPGGRAS